MDGTCAEVPVPAVGGPGLRNADDTDRCLPSPRPAPPPPRCSLRKGCLPPKSPGTAFTTARTCCPSPRASGCVPWRCGRWMTRCSKCWWWARS